MVASHKVRRTARTAMLMILALAMVWLLRPTASASSAEPNVAIADGPLCRFGVNVTNPLNQLQSSHFAQLGIGWYLDYGAGLPNNHPNELDFVPVIRLSQNSAGDFSYSPSGAALQSAIASNLGADWLIGNEPDRRGSSQDNMEPAPYAAAYHELYYLIKAADPTAHIFAGTIVQPTPIRLQYLDHVLASYIEQFGQPMPVDGWSIHAFILNEVSCAYDPGNCWGAEIPPGIHAPYGEVLTIEDNDRMDLFIERIERFRYWMKDRGYADTPLYLTEYGILMPPDLGFPADRVNAFMNETFDYLRSATNPALGYKPDGGRLVQKWSWFSTATTASNGWLFDPVTLELSPMGVNFAAYTAGVQRQVDLFPAALATNPPSPHSTGGPVDLQLLARIANDGNRQHPTGPVTVRFYDGDPAGGKLIGQVNSGPLAGCGATASASVSWQGVQPGTHQVYVVVDPTNVEPESDETNNVSSFTVLVSTQQTYLPQVVR